MGKARATTAQKPCRLRGGYPVSPGRGTQVRKALFDVQTNKVSLREAARQHGFSYGFLQRRLSGEIDVDKRKGPNPVFNQAEKAAMSSWLHDMAERGMGLKPYKFLDFIQGVIIKENKPNSFKDGRPGHDWYYAFMARNEAILQPRTEKSLEMCRTKINKEDTDVWYSGFSQFLSEKNLLNKPKRIWNCDETGFSIGSIPGKIIGPVKTPSDRQQMPHISGGHSKQRYTVMFCGNASGDMMLPFFVFPEPKPKGYNPMTEGLEGSRATYTKKDWMNLSTFKSFISFFDEHAGTERPVVLLMDSVSSHVDITVFQYNYILETVPQKIF
ncbi:uncharacterized protein LOC117342449 [Pecten maximus]|uniref:uncharacterized protein LOC117342449 n=1 Tax=Pecten maximus TaxID=6579 RepID=UPI0014581026|nr:uncharacterized protein LOC117342449 [Pecten maximus]